MNKRLIELKIEAWDYACSKIPPDALGLKNHGDYFAEKFAELIIRECIDICEQTHDTSNGRMRCANDDESIRIIKERFGVTNV